MAVCLKQRVRCIIDLTLQALLETVLTSPGCALPCCGARGAVAAGCLSAAIPLSLRRAALAVHAYNPEPTNPGLINKDSS